MRTHRLVIAAATLLLAGAAERRAQEWTPPSRTMPEMPTAATLGGSWQGGLDGWFPGGTGGVSARGEGAGAQGRLQYARFTGGVRPVATWSDRNRDGRCDMLEIFRSGALAYRLVDADYDGTADVLVAYDASGNVVKETRL